MNFKSIYKLGSPPLSYRLCIALEPWFLISSILLIAVGMYSGLFVAPPDYEMGDAFRIIYVHVPSAWLALLTFAIMTIYSIIALAFKIPFGFIINSAVAPIGAIFTLICLVTGSLWGKPMWGTAWVWDARLTSELILLFLYLAYIMLHLSIPDRSKADRATALLAIVGVVNIPIIHYSVVWWNTLHQASTISKFAKPSIATEMLWPLIIMILGYTLLFAAFLAKRTAAELAVREKRTRWLQTLIVGDKNNA
jgi:heme exporter protein C